MKIWRLFFAIRFLLVGSPGRSDGLPGIEATVGKFLLIGGLKKRGEKTVGAFTKKASKRP
jgi:hypothetical protein